jgi:hypothetical protein
MADLVLLVALVLSVAVAHGANARLARLITEDEITVFWRDWLIAKLGPQHLITRWAHCPWCAGWWTAWPVTAVAWFPIAGMRLLLVFFLAVWSVAHAAGRLNHNHGS